MSQQSIEQERAELAAINQQPTSKKLGYFVRKSGPGWLQGAITLGGGSLAGALYLGIIAGTSLMWLQPLGMILGVIMLSAIAYVTLSTGERPFGLINRNLSPALGWAWIIATLAANIIWCMPQFNLGVAAAQQNILGIGDSTGSTVAICAILFVIAFVVNWFYGSGAGGIRLFEMILKIMVGLVVISFFGVVAILTVNGGIEWGKVFKGLIPNVFSLGKPAPEYAALIESSTQPEVWKTYIGSEQTKKIIAAFGTAVGINMTFLLPYSMLKKRWGREHRPLAIFDLSLGLIIPFVIATSCVVIAAASQFHAKTNDILDENGAPRAGFEAPVAKVLSQLGEDANPNASDTQLAAMLVNRDNFQLANALEPLAGPFVAQKVFGFGVLAMALSTIIILMLINGFVFCEMAGKPEHRHIHMLGALVAGVGGFMGPFIWGNAEAKAAFAIPTSVLGASLLPIAYFTFFLLMNSKRVLGDALPTGGKRMLWNVLMIPAILAAAFASYKGLSGQKAAFFNTPITWGQVGLGVLVILFVLGLIGFFTKGQQKRA